MHIDLPDVVQQCREDPRFASNNRVTLIACDLSMPSELIAQLTRHGIQPSRPTVLLFECVTSYMEPEDRHNLLVKLSQSFEDAHLVMYDPMLRPIPGQEKAMGYSTAHCERFSLRGAPLISAFSTPADAAEAFYRARWPHVCVMTLYQALQILTLAGVQVPIETGEVFDEFASLVLLLQLYTISFGSSCKHHAEHYCIFSEIFKKIFSITETPTTSASVGDDLRIRAILKRIEVCEARVAALEKKRHSEGGDNDRQNDLVREAVTQDAKLLAPLYDKVYLNDLIYAIHACGGSLNLFNNPSLSLSLCLYQCFSTYYESDASIKKFIKHSLKQLSDLDQTYRKEKNDRLFVLEHQREGSQSETKTIIGCIGVRMIGSKNNDLKSKRYELGHFCVDKEYRQRGFGSVLLTRVSAAPAL